MNQEEINRLAFMAKVLSASKSGENLDKIIISPPAASPLFVDLGRK